jgi:membrane protease YdiL (CAAX protease family)
MEPSIASEILRAVVSGLILAILFGAIATWVWTIPRLFRGQPLLPQQPIVERQPPSWGVGTILLVLAAYILVSHYAFRSYGRLAHPEWGKAGVAAPDRVEKKEAQAADLAKPTPKEEAKPDARHPDEQDEELPYGLTPLEAMSIQGAINAFFILLVPLLARLTSGARFPEFGLSLRRWRRQLAVGVVAILFLMPIVYSIQAACIRLLDMSTPEIEKHRHPLEKMLRESLSPGLASVAFLTAVVLAPAFEELFFRGFLQPWLVMTLDRLATRRRSALEKPFEEPSLAGTTRTDPLADPDIDRLPAVGPDAGFDCWESAESPAHVAEPSGLTIAGVEDQGALFRPHSPLWPGFGIALTSLIFAALHAPQWPAPIPLFLLALGLGFVVQRTGSLTAAICMHAIFNGFSTMMLFFVAMERPDQARPPARPVLERVAPAEKHGAIAPEVPPGPRPGKT